MFAMKAIFAIATLLSTTAVNGHLLRFAIPEDSDLLDVGRPLSMWNGTHREAKVEIPKVDEKKVLTWLWYVPGTMKMTWNVTIDATVTKAYDSTKAATYSLSDASPWLTVIDDLDSTTFVTTDVGCVATTNDCPGEAPHF